MTLATSDAREKANYAVLAALGLNGLEAALAASSGDTSHAWVAVALTAATYYAVYKKLADKAAATRNAALGLAVAHAVVAAASIPLHTVLFLELAVAGALAWVAKEIKDAAIA